MIVRDTPKPWQLLFILRGSIIPAIWPQLLLVVVISAVVTTLDLSGALRLQEIAPLPFSLIGIALSIFSGFRNSASYERWWEGRRLLGQLVIDCRSLSRAALAHLPEARGRTMAQLTTAFARSLKAHLRGEAMPADSLGTLPEAVRAKLAASRTPPDTLLNAMSSEIAGALSRAEISAPIAQVLEERVISLSGVLAGTERIKLTPLPFAYSLLLHRTVYLFCFLLPFGLAETAGIWTPLLCGILAYTFFGLDALGDELANPFGTGQNALPLSAIVRTIEINIAEHLGETELPAAIPVTNFVLD